MNEKNQPKPGKPPEPPERYIGAAEVGTHFSVTGRHILNLATRGDIPSLRLGKSIRFCLEDVTTALETLSGTRRCPPEEDPPRSAPTPRTVLPRS